MKHYRAYIKFRGIVGRDRKQKLHTKYYRDFTPDECIELSAEERCKIESIVDSQCRVKPQWIDLLLMEAHDNNGILSVSLYNSTNITIRSSNEHA